MFAVSPESVMVTFDGGAASKVVNNAIFTHYTLLHHYCDTKFAQLYYLII